MQRALVLGGGGVIGVAWETGLVIGLAEVGLAFDAWDVIVGTSAGAMVGTQLSHGRMPKRSELEHPRRDQKSPFDPSALDAAAIGAAFTHWQNIERTTPAQAKVIGAIARTLYRDQEPEWLAKVAAILGVSSWPERALLVTAVDTDSGERAVFRRDSGASIVQAVAASAAVPALTASVEIDGRLYMDGQVHSSTHADLLLELAPREVVVAMPCNIATAQGIGAHAERAADAEIALLRQAGVRVLHVTPSAEQAASFGGNLMSAKHVPEAFSAGLASGRTLGLELGR